MAVTQDVLDRRVAGLAKLGFKSPAQVKDGVFVYDTQTKAYTHLGKPVSLRAARRMCNGRVLSVVSTAANLKPLDDILAGAGVASKSWLKIVVVDEGWVVASRAATWHAKYTLAAKLLACMPKDWVDDLGEVVSQGTETVADSEDDRKAAAIDALKTWLSDNPVPAAKPARKPRTPKAKLPETPAPAQA